MKRLAFALVGALVCSVMSASAASQIDPSALVRAASSGNLLPLDLGDSGRVTLRLWVNPILAPGARFTTTDAHGRFHPAAREPFTPLAGSVTGDPSSVVRLTTTGRSVSGYIFTRGRTITFDAVRGGTVIGHPRSSEAAVSVGEDSVRPARVPPPVPLPPVSVQGVGNCLVFTCNVLTAGAILDGDTYFRAINSATCQSRQIAIFNAVDGIYEQASTRVHLVANQVNCRTAADLGTSASDPNVYLGNLRLAWNAVNADRSYVHLSVGFDFAGGVIGLGFQPGVCERIQPDVAAVPQSCDYGYSLYQAVAGGGYTATSFMQTKLSAHETGHNFNAIHDDSSPDPITCPSAAPRNGQIMCSIIQEAGPNTFSTKSATAIRAWAEHSVGSITGT